MNHLAAGCLALVACTSSVKTTNTRPAGTSQQPIGGVDHVGLTVTDLEASKQFFVQQLGFRVRKHDPVYPAYFLTNGHTVITLWRVKKPATAVAFDRKRNVGLHHLAFAVASFDALDAAYERIRRHPGVRIEFPPEPAYGGPAKHMMFQEPSGNRIELVHRPH